MPPHFLFNKILGFIAHYLTITQSLVLFHAGFLQLAVCRSLKKKKKEPIKHSSLNSEKKTPSCLCHPSRPFGTKSNGEWLKFLRDLTNCVFSVRLLKDLFCSIIILRGAFTRFPHLVKRLCSKSNDQKIKFNPPRATATPANKLDGGSDRRDKHSADCLMSFLRSLEKSYAPTAPRTP